MKMEDLFEDGRIVKGVNTTVDVDLDQIPKEVSKFGNKVDKDGRPPTLSKKVKGNSTNVLYNLGLAESTEPRYTAMEWACIEGGHCLEDIQPKAKEPGDIFKALEGAAIKNPKNTFLTKSDTAYDFLRIGKTISNLSTAKKTDNRDEPDVMVVPFGGEKEKDHLKKGLKKAGYKTQDADKDGDDSHVDENFADGKKKGKSRPGRVKRSGASCNGSVTALRKRAKNASGEKAKMYHWCANMKSGRKKK
jgi:hypothetical protein